MKKELLKGVSIDPKIIDTKLGKIEVDISDKDVPVILGCHGGVGGVDQSRLLIQFAEEDYRLLSVSRPGYLGTPIESGRTPEEQADLFAATLDALKIDKVAVISASFGGPFGYVFAYRHPDRIWALVTCDGISGHYDIPETAGPITQVIFLSNIGQSLLQSLTKLKPDAFVKKFFQTEAYFTKDQLKKHIDFVQDDEYIKEWIIAFMNAMYPYKPRKIGTENDMDIFVSLKGHYPVEKIICPSLIVHGTNDSDAKFYDGVYAYEHIPGAERIWIEEGSHICFWVNEKSRDAQKQVLDFLRKHQPLP